MHENKLAMIAGIDHFVLTVASLEVTCAFYQRVLGFERIDAPGRPTALAFGTQKINVTRFAAPSSRRRSRRRPVRATSA
jgi:catechol 2,3-dioxygenase-like lactoylglutathione lyase family enzyme